ncbi:Ubiquitin carboxyl-terminal hydrolase 3 [Nymphon striatum]|nr:Ubiquitin carboxyl-terminal hydrolase 3 [Nymphon striatum]
MECPHLVDCVKISHPSSTKENENNKWTCAGNAEILMNVVKQLQLCSTDESPWICLTCGMIQCGRYVNEHGKMHYDKQNDHAVCMECNTFATFCYTCDDFVINDTETKQLEELRGNLKQLNDQIHVHKLRSRKHQSSEGDENSDRKRAKKKTKAKAGKRAKIVGLRNLGNTCFMNAVLQSLSNIQQFSGYFKQLPSLDSTPVKNGRKPPQTRTSDVDTVLLAEELRKILILLWQSGKGAISPESLFTVIWKVVPRFRGYQQQDAHEFLRYMLDRLHTELLGILPFSNDPTSRYISNLSIRGKSTIVTAIFGGILQSEVNCLECSTESKKHDPFLDLSLDLPSHIIGKTVKQKDQKDQKDCERPASCSIYDCLSSFTELEKLADTEQYFCNNCKCRQQSTKKFWIRRLPNVLCLHLKRFRWSNYFRTKLDHYVEFPVKGLDMKNYLLTNMIVRMLDINLIKNKIVVIEYLSIITFILEYSVEMTTTKVEPISDYYRLINNFQHGTRGSGTGSCLYDLAAVIVHHGSGLNLRTYLYFSAGSGHYTAYGTHESNWYHFNDSSVTICDEETVQSSKAYILFYIKREVKIPMSLLSGARVN